MTFKGIVTLPGTAPQEYQEATPIMARAIIEVGQKYGTDVVVSVILSTLLNIPETVFAHHPEHVRQRLRGKIIESVEHTLGIMRQLHSSQLDWGELIVAAAAPRPKKKTPPEGDANNGEGT